MSAALQFLLDLPAAHDAGQRRGLTSVCSAHPLVIEAALLEAAAHNAIALIEATCNQVNQDGGYTGMTPAGFRDYVLAIADQIKFPMDRILFGGDHLGPNPWRKLSASQAMDKAVVMTVAYASAGFAKIHLDASMSCADDPSPLPAVTIAKRAAVLAAAADAAAKVNNLPPPAYIIGTEVPVPGGAAEEIERLEVTSPAGAAETIAIHEKAFESAGLQEAFDRSIGLVVQPGVEFGHANIIHFDPAGARDLSLWRDDKGGIVFEAHSTDYQTAAALSALVDEGFAILKVGPGLTFALREALYGLDQIAGLICEGYDAGTLPETMEKIMMAAPDHWQDYYHGSATEQYINRHFSYSDRIRYYWTDPIAQSAVERLLAVLDGTTIPETLISQFLPRQYAGAVNGHSTTARDLAIVAVRAALDPYSSACKNLGVPYDD